MAMRLWCRLIGHKRGGFLGRTNLGRHHYLTFTCDRCHRAFRVEWWDPR